MDATAKRVTITASSPTVEEGKFITRDVSLNVEYPAVSTNSEVADGATGAIVKPTKVSKNDLEGEVIYERPADASAVNVQVPDTVEIYGVRYKVTQVDPGAFTGNKQMKSVTIGKYVTAIEENAFSGCTALTKVVIPASVTKIGKKAFNNCKKLKTVTFKGKSLLTEIGDNAFAGCKALTAFTVQSKVTRIGSKAFYNCSKLKKLTIKSSVLSVVGKNAFKNIYKKAVIMVPKKKLANYKVLLKGKGQKKTVKIKK